MKLMIASDIHGSACYCRQLMQAYERETPDRLLLLGDLLYHGPRNDLPPEYAPKAVIEMLNARRDAILCVRGNCEADVDQMVLDFPVLAEHCLLYLGPRAVFVTHGHVCNTANPPRLAVGDILLHGHTHVPACEIFGRDNLYLNPGSVSLPKQGSPHSYMMLTDEGFVWKTLEGEIYKHRQR